MNIWIPFLSALAGAIVGACASIVTVIVQSKSEREREAARLSIENRRARIQLAVQAGIEEHKHIGELAMRTPGYKNIAPLCACIYSNTKLIDLMEEGELTPEKMAEVGSDVTALMKVLEQHSGIYSEKEGD